MMLQIGYALLAVGYTLLVLQHFFK
jgi:hypothetical protein